MKFSTLSSLYLATYSAVLAITKDATSKGIASNSNEQRNHKIAVSNDQGNDGIAPNNGVVETGVALNKPAPTSASSEMVANIRAVAGRQFSNLHKTPLSEFNQKKLFKRGLLSKEIVEIAKNVPEAAPTIAKYFKTREPIKPSDLHRVTLEESPFGSGSIHEINKFQDVAFKAIKSKKKLNGLEKDTDYFAKKIITSKIEALKYTTRHDMAEGFKEHYAFSEISAGLAYARFFGVEFTPKSRFIQNPNNPSQLLVASKINKDLFTLEDLEKKMGTTSFKVFDDAHNQARSLPIVIDAEGKARISDSIEGYSGKAVNGLGKYAAATWFLAERDTNAGNIGFVLDKVNPNTLNLVKLDHGYSFFFESDPGRITRIIKGNPQSETISAEDFLTPEHLAKRLEDVGGTYLKDTQPFKEFVATTGQIASITKKDLDSYIADIFKVYPKQNENDQGILEKDVIENLNKRVDFAKKAMAAHERRSNLEAQI